MTLNITMAHGNHPVMQDILQQLGGTPNKKCPAEVIIRGEKIEGTTRTAEEIKAKLRILINGKVEGILVNDHSGMYDKLLEYIKGKSSSVASSSQEPPLKQIKVSGGEIKMTKDDLEQLMVCASERGAQRALSNQGNLMLQNGGTNDQLNQKLDNIEKHCKSSHEEAVDALVDKARHVGDEEDPVWADAVRTLVTEAKEAEEGVMWDKAVKQLVADTERDEQGPLWDEACDTLVTKAEKAQGGPLWDEACDTLVTKAEKAQEGVLWQEARDALVAKTEHKSEEEEEDKSEEVGEEDGSESSEFVVDMSTKPKKAEEEEQAEKAKEKKEKKKEVEASDSDVPPLLESQLKLSQS